jgi:hypothetical protein
LMPVKHLIHGAPRREHSAPPTPKQGPR